MPASVRKSDIASMLENFLDSNEDDLSPNMFSALNDLAGEIDDAAIDLENQNEELIDQIREMGEKE